MSHKLIPLANILPSSSVNFQWEAANSDPQFLISMWEQFRGKAVLFSFEIKASPQDRFVSRLYLDYGAGLSEDNAVQLFLKGDGRCSQEIVFTKGLIGLRFDPVDIACHFSILSFKAEILPYSELELEPLLSRQNKLRGRTGLTHVDDDIYQEWLDSEESRCADRSIFYSTINSWSKKPLVSIVVPTYNTPARWLKKCIESVVGQIYPHWELCIADDNSTDPNVKKILSEYAKADDRIKVFLREENGHICAATNSALSISKGEHIGFLDHDDELHPLALYHVVEALQLHPDLSLIYTDEDKISTEGVRSEPYFKSDFNYDLLMSQNMICHFSVYKAAVLKKLGGVRIGFEGAQDYDLALRVIDLEGFKSIYHVPHVLYHWRIIPGSTAGSHEAKPYAYLAAERALQDHILRNKINAKVADSPQVSGYHKITYELPERLPLVEIIVLADGEFSLLIRCLESIANNRYLNYSITVIAESLATDDLNYSLEKLVDFGVQKVLISLKETDFIEYVNKSAFDSSADFIFFISNHLEAASSSWLEEMIALATQKNVGIVGPKLVNAGGFVSNTGMAIKEDGSRLNPHSLYPIESLGYFGRAQLRGAVSAVDPRCMLISKSLFKEAEGFNPLMRRDLGALDICLRLIEFGYRNVWTPYAEFCVNEKNLAPNNLAFVSTNDSKNKILKERFFSKKLSLIKDFYAD